MVWSTLEITVHTCPVLFCCFSDLVEQRLKQRLHGAVRQRTPQVRNEPRSQVVMRDLQIRRDVEGYWDLSMNQPGEEGGGLAYQPCVYLVLIPVMYDESKIVAKITTLTANFHIYIFYVFCHAEGMLCFKAARTHQHQ